MHLRSAVIPIVALTAVGARADDQFRWLTREIFNRIEITGYRNLGYHHHTVDGDQNAFNSLNYYGQGDQRFTNMGNINIAGRKVLGMFDFNMVIPDNRFSDPQAQKFTLDYNKGPFQVQAGDIMGSLLNTNSFASLSRSMKGISAQYSAGRLTVKAVRTEGKGSPRTVSMQGSNSTGPYYLQSSQVINDSEKVMVDGQEMRLGQDYVINYDLGSITFLTKVVSPTSTIVVTYETLGVNSRPGLLQGYGASYDMGKFGRIGFTNIEQKSRSGGGLVARLEQFQGFGAPSTPYFLEFEPLPGTTLIRVDGIIQREFVDYIFDTNNKSIFYFTRFMPTTSNVDVVYTPRPTTIVDGDRRVMGFDYRLPIGRDRQSYISYSQATGEIKSATPMKGTARGINVVYKTGALNLRTGWKDVPDTYVGVESRGFNRNEKSWDMAAEYAKGPFTYGASYQNGSVSTRQIQPDGSVLFNPARTTTARASVAYAKEGGLNWNLEQRRTASQFRGNETRLDTTAITANKSFGKLNTRFGLDYQSGKGLIAGTEQRIGLQTARLEADYKPRSEWTLTARTSLSKVSAGGESGNGQDVSLGASYRPSEKLNVDVNYTDSNSGQLATLSGFQTGYGVGYDGNGFSGGALGNPFSGGGTNVRLLQARAQYNATDRLSLDARFYRSLSAGSVSSNTETTSMGFGANWDMGGGTALTVSLDKSSTTFLGGANSSSAVSLDANLRGKVGKKWSYGLGSSVLLSGGNSEFAQDNFSLDASLIHHLSAKQNLSLRWQHGRTTGYLPQNDSFLGMFYEHQLYANVSLVAGYKIRTVSNLDPFLNTGAYASRGFDLELSFNFGR